LLHEHSDTRTAVDEGRVSAGDVDIAYHVSGEGPPLVLIAGLGGAKELWTAEFLSALAGSFQVVAFDNRGIGGSSAGTEEFGIQQFARDTTALMDSLEIERAHLLGYSMGGYIAQELALEHPERVEKLILVGTECGGAGGVRQEPGILIELTGGGKVSSGVEKRFFLSADWIAGHAVNLGDIFGTASRRDAAASRKQAEAIRRWNGTCSRLPDIDKPTLVITGTEDIVILPENARVLSELIPGAKLVEMEGGDHGFIERFPTQLASLVTDFLQ
jgi:pimeloyl-ACP methyl ester carboxylesterase